MPLRGSAFEWTRRRLNDRASEKREATRHTGSVPSRRDGGERRARVAIDHSHQSLEELREMPEHPRFRVRVVGVSCGRTDARQ